jgi:hypothetical protein
VQAVQELGERLGDQRADRLATGLGGATDPAGQVGRELDGEHDPGLGHLDLPVLAGLGEVAAGLALRQALLGGQLPCCLGDVVAAASSATAALMRCARWSARARRLLGMTFGYYL